MTALEKHLYAEGPKRILALDGGGIRGALTLGYLQKIEDILRRQHGNEPGFRLCHYFDLIGGTSTGSIIASLLATGKTIAEIKTMYFDLGGKIFAKKYKWWNIFKWPRFLYAGYDQRPLEEELHHAFGDITLGSDQIQTGLCIVTKRADTNSVWPLINHPKGKYYDSADGRNKDIPLWQAVRASAAAPTYFLPQMIDTGGAMPTAAFVDGGVSMANNPALQLLMVATLRGFPFHWKWGAENIFLVSAGTGMSRWEKMPEKVSKNNLLHWASQLPDMFMQDASWHNQAILQWLSDSPTAWEIDGESGSLSGDMAGTHEKDKGFMSYLRYNLWLDQKSIGPLMNKSYTKEEIDDLVEMSNTGSRFELYEIGEKAAAKEVLPDHFPASFKI
ncbi:MAG: patatin-like phospholipase family protein [Chitinophagaceae bacterium]|nr:patatin-like phospholipase family protein [Chitinophagaceae bacterium]